MPPTIPFPLMSSIFISLLVLGLIMTLWSPQSPLGLNPWLTLKFTAICWIMNLISIIILNFCSLFHLYQPIPLLLIPLSLHHFTTVMVVAAVVVRVVVVPIIPLQTHLPPIPIIGQLVNFANAWVTLWFLAITGFTMHFKILPHLLSLVITRPYLATQWTQTTGFLIRQLPTVSRLISQIWT